MLSQNRIFFLLWTLIFCFTKSSSSFYVGSSFACLSSCRIFRQPTRQQRFGLPNGETPESRRPPGFAMDSEGPYFPAGLTKEEYAEIKRKEAEAASKLDLGAWGPRFNRSQRPDGDWLLQPQLWTFGFRSGTEKNGKKDNSQPGLSDNKWLVVIRQIFQQHYAPFILGWLCLNVVWSSVSFFRSPKQLPSLVFQHIARAFLRSIIIPKTAITMRLITSLAMTWPLKKYVETASRRRLWTQRRMCISTAGAALAGWFLLTVVLASRV